MGKEQLTNTQFLKMIKDFDSEDGKILTYLIAHDKNKNNQKVYNTLLNEYFSYYEKEIHYHGSWYEPTGTFEFVGNLPEPISYKLSKVYAKIKNEEKMKEITDSLNKNPKIKNIYDKIEL